MSPEFFFGIGHLLQKGSCRVDFTTGELYNCFHFAALLYKTAVIVETPQSAALWRVLWPI